MPKKYSKSVDYEKKLVVIMERIGAESYNYDWTRSDCFIEFSLKGQLYRFEHSLTKAAENGQKIVYVSDLFAQLVLALEDIARLSERGIYKLQSWIEGMKALPPAKNLSPCFAAMGFVQEPTEEEIKTRYRALAKIMHPDAGGIAEDFAVLTENYEKCIKQLEEGRGT